MKKCAVVRLSGKVTSATDNATPVLGATIAISGDNDLTTTTDAEGGYSLSGVYAQKNYTIKVTAPGYEVYDYYGGYPVTFDSADDSTATFDINLTPTTAAPYSAEAVDEGNKAVVTWQKPIENITLTKTSDKVVGQFGGAYNMYIGHRYTSAELKTLGVDSLYYIKAVKLVPMASSTFELAIWQGEEGNEERVYAQKFTPEKYGAWVTVDLSQPIKVDTEKSLVVGYTVESNVGAYPVGFDAGPVADGGDCLFDLTMNKWSTAREQLSSMNYNWAIKAVLGNDNNAREVAWATAPQSEAKVASAYNVIPLDSVPARLLTEAPAALATHYGVKMLSAAVRPLAPAKAEAINKIKGYNVYRLEPGQESQTWNWTLLNSEPVTTLKVFRKDYTVSEDEVGTWTGLTLEKPIKIDPSKTYYVGYAVTSKTDEYPMAVDDNGYPAEGGCYMYGWDQMNARYGWYFVQTVGNWMIRAHITDTPDSAKAKLGDVAYNLYRMKADDAANVAAWTKVNAAPIASTYYTDATWNDLADNTDYRYAVKSVFFDNTESAATFGKVMNKGALALLTAKVQTNNNLSAAGAVVRLHAGSLNYKAVVGSDGMAVVPEVVKGNGYEITVVKEGYDTLKVVSDIVSTFDTLTFQLAEVKPAPVGLTVQTAADNASVNINWLAPGSYVPKEGWAYWDTNEPYGGFGTSTGTGSVGQLYTPADQVEKGMKGLDITKIAFFTSDPSNNPVLDGAHWTVNIWRKTNGDNFEEVYSQEVENAKKPAWNEVALNTPYHVSGDETLLIGYTFYGSGSPFGIDAGPVVTGKTDWANFGQGWTSLASAVSGFNYNLLVHTYLEKAESASTAVAPAIAPAEKIGGEAAIAGGICPMKKAVAAKAAANHLRLAYAYPVKGYLVYRVAAGDENDESRWTALTASPINATSFVDDAWKSVEPGKQYLWAVKAAYVSGTSEAAFTETLNSDGTLGVDDITTNGFSVSKIADGTFEVTVPVAATLTVTSVAGAEVYSGSLEAGKNVVRIYAPQGIYLFGATATGFHQVKKVVVK